MRVWFPVIESSARARDDIIVYGIPSVAIPVENGYDFYAPALFEKMGWKWVKIAEVGEIWKDLVNGEVDDEYDVLGIDLEYLDDFDLPCAFVDMEDDYEEYWAAPVMESRELPPIEKFVEEHCDTRTLRMLPNKQVKFEIELEAVE